MYERENKKASKRNEQQRKEKKILDMILYVNNFYDLLSFSSSLFGIEIK